LEETLGQKKNVKEEVLAQTSPSRFQALENRPLGRGLNAPLYCVWINGVAE